MIKKFFAKLTSWNAERRPGWDKENINRTMERNRIEEMNAREREQQHKANMRQDRVIPRVDTSAPSEPESSERAA